MGFPIHQDYPNGSTTIASGGYTSGSGQVTVATGTGSLFGSPTSTNPIRITLASAATPSTCCHYTCTGRTSDTLTGLTVLDGTDQNFLSGDTCENRVYNADWQDVYTVLTTLLGLSGFVTVTGGTLGADATIPNAGLTNSSLTVTAGTGLTGGGSVSLGSSVTVSLSSPVSIANGGTGQTGAAAAYNALSPMSTLGDLEYESAANTASRLAGNTSATKKFLTQTGTGSVSAAPAWATIAAGDLPAPTASTLGGIESYAAVSHQWINAISTAGAPSSTQPAFTDISGTITTAQVGASQITYAKIQNMSATTLLGNPTGSAAAPSEITLGSGLSFSGTTLTATGGGSGTVTSVTFTGDGTVLSSTPSSAVTTSGTLTATLNTQSANTVLAGPSSGSAAAPTFRALGTADMPAGVPVLQFALTAPYTIASPASTGSLVSSASSPRGSLTIASGALNAAGRIIEIDFAGYASSATTSPGGLYLVLYLGGNVVGSFYTGAVMNANRTNIPFGGRMIVTVATVGSGGTVNVGGTLSSQAAQTGVFSSSIVSAANAAAQSTTAPTTAQTVNTTGTVAIDFQAYYSSAAQAGNTITLTELVVRITQ